MSPNRERSTQKNEKVIKLVPCLFIDWGAPDRDIFVLQQSGAAKRHPAETSSFTGSFKVWVSKIAQYYLADTANCVFVLEKFRAFNSDF